MFRSFVVFLIAFMSIFAFRVSFADDNEKPQITTPQEAFSVWSAKDVTPDAKQDAISFLKNLIDSAPYDSVLFSDACSEMAKVYTADKDFDSLIALRERQLSVAGEDVNRIYSAAGLLSDAFVSKGDDPAAADIVFDILQKYPSSANFNGAWTRLTTIYRRFNQPDHIIKTCAMLLARETDPVVIFPVATLLASVYTGGKDYENAAQVWENFLERNIKTAAPANIVTTAHSLTTIYSANMNQPDSAVNMLARVIEGLSPENKSEVSSLLVTKASLLFNKEDFTGAAREYEAAIAAVDFLPAANIAGVYVNLSHACQEIGESERGVENLLDGLSKYSLPMSSQLVSLLIGLTKDEASLVSAIMILHEKIVADLALNKPVDVYQFDIMRLFVNAGKSREALQEGRVMLYSCPDNVLPAALEHIAWVYKSSDGNLGRANIFLKYQKHGAAGEDGKIGTSDDIPDLLADVPPVSDEQRNAIYESYIKSLPVDWQGYKKRGDALVFLDRYIDSVHAYRRAFELCPMVEKDLQIIINSVAILMIRVAKDVSLAERFVEYIMFGEAGKDGRVGTKNDLKDPLPEIIARLSSDKVKD